MPLYHCTHAILMRPPVTSVIVDQLLAFTDGRADLTTQDIKLFCTAHAYSFPTINNRLKEYKVGRGHFNLDVAKAAEKLERDYEAQVDSNFGSSYEREIDTLTAPPVNLVPAVDDLFVPFGTFKDVKQIIKSGVFYPLFITGLSGNGKTHGVEQACAQLKREVIRVNITIETDADDLVGGFRLKNGETVWHDGPVVEAMRRGAILLLDEIDLASNKIMCLQSILEGKGYYIKKTGVFVTPAAGFNVIATANTKGRSDETGRFIGTNVLNEAFLERFAVTFEQQYPTPATESKILARNFVALGVDHDETLVKHLVDWADIIRKTFADGGVDDVISTRRLVNIAKAIAIWGDTDKAIELCTNRFDADTSHTFRELFQKVAGDAHQTPSADAVVADTVAQVTQSATAPVS